MALHIINATLDEFDLSKTEWKRLKSLAVTNGQIGKIVGRFARYTTISCLNFSSNSLKSIQAGAFSNLYNLNSLDLSNNNLSTIPNFTKYLPIKLDVSSMSFKKKNYFFLNLNVLQEHQC